MKRPVLASGNFDPFHPGHVGYLQVAKRLAEEEQRRLLVAVTPDHLVAPKHPPVLTALERASLVAPFADDVALGGAASVIRQFRPAVYVKGADWRDRLPLGDREACRAAGCRIEYVDSGRPERSSDLLVRWRQRVDTEALATLQDRYASQPAPTAETFDEAYFAQQGYDLATRRRVEGTWPRQLIDLFSPQSALDYGCGPGTMMALLAEQQPGLRIHGLDIGRREGLDGTYDLVICREVLEHIPFRQWLWTIDDLCRFVGQWLFITTRFCQQPFSAFSTDAKDDLDPTHISLMTPEALRAILVLHGLQRDHEREQALDGKRDGRVLVYRRVQRG